MTVKTLANRFFYELGIGSVDLSSDTFKAALMQDGFTFDPDNHDTYSDVSANEISNNGGYAVSGEILSIASAWAQDNSNDKGAISFANHDFTASGANYDDFSAVIIYDDSHSNGVVMGCIDFEQTLTVPDGGSWELKNTGFNLRGQL